MKVSDCYKPTKLSYQELIYHQETFALRQNLDKYQDEVLIRFCKAMYGVRNNYYSNQKATLVRVINRSWRYVRGKVYW